MSVGDSAQKKARLFRAWDTSPVFWACGRGTGKEGEEGHSGSEESGCRGLAKRFGAAPVS